MTDNFFSLSLLDQKEIVQTVANKLSKSQEVVEKDLIVVWVLDKIFTMPDALPMAFKGGTSLSKVFKLINRFSEDLDITIDYRVLDESIDPFDNNASKTKIKKYSEKLKSRVAIYLKDVVHPYIQSAAKDELSTRDVVITIEGGENLYIEYKSVLDNPSFGYIKNKVLVEFGGRNVIEPNEKHLIKTELSTTNIKSVNLPEANVIVLSPRRTFWEKVTLIHVACNNPNFNAGRGHQFRHWYDIAMMMKDSIGIKASSDKKLLDDVIALKRVFYNASYSNYDDCLDGKFSLVPEQGLLKALKADYQAMCTENMFYSSPPEFDEVIEEMRELQTSLRNAS